MREGIETRLVYGFLGAGKTSYIEDSIRNDYFHKYGVTLILCFEQGEEEYTEETLAEKRTFVSFYEGEETVGAFCERSIEAFRPDRIYVEMNTMMQDLPEQLPECLRVTFAVTLIEWATLPLYFVNFKQMIRKMTASSQQVIFRGCPSKELLAPYSQTFRLMNQKASYLRQDPLGYHEKAFDLFLPFSLEEKEIVISEKDYLPFWLDAHDHPEHYEGKTLRFADSLELRRKDAVHSGEDGMENGAKNSAINNTSGRWRAGRVVMTCCMADLQFMSFELEERDIPDCGWTVFSSAGVIRTDMYGQKRLVLRPGKITPATAPERLILIPGA